MGNEYLGAKQKKVILPVLMALAADTWAAMAGDTRVQVRVSISHNANRVFQ